MDKLKIIIIDDEKRVRISLTHILKLHYPAAEIVGEADNVINASEIIKLNQPDVILLDIKMPGGTGFDLLKELMPIKYKVIFITAFDQYAIKAFKYNAVDYLLKPVIPDELIAALNKAKEGLNKEQENNKLKALLNNLETNKQKITLNTQEATFVLEVNQIVRCEADRNYTRFFLADNKNILVSGGLKEYEDMLKPFGFMRPHHSHLVNVFFINRLDKKNGGVLILNDGSKVPVSTRKFKETIEAIKNT